MAVEMCKLSLWLVSLDRDLPFSFVDDKVFLGNSLLGLTSLDQLRKLHIDPCRAPVDRLFDIFDVDIDAIVRKAVGLRERLANEIDEDDPARSSAAKRRQLDELRRVTADLRQIADGVIAAGLSLGGKPGKPLDEAYEDLRLAVKQAHPGPNDGDASNGWLESIIDCAFTPTVETDYERWRPLHWLLEAPDVVIEHGGFDAVVGNPPFLGGQKITGAMGSDVRDWFVNVLASGARGSADLVAYFFLRAEMLLRTAGTLGLIATNTIAQGVTREIGLEAMVTRGFQITRAIQSRSWPAASANLEFAAVWGTWSAVDDRVSRDADGVLAGRISSLLEAEGRVAGDPFELTENLNIAYQGCIVLGKGFILEPGIARDLLASDPRHAEVVRPYLNGEDLNQRPDCSPSRWVIDFDELSEEDAKAFPGPFRHVVDNVRLERQRNADLGARRFWWRFLRPRPAMRGALKDLDCALVIAQVSRTLMPVRVPTNQVFDAKLIVFASDDWILQAVLSSSAHLAWSSKYGTTMRTDATYTPSTLF
jgi:hypothetical protein